MNVFELFAKITLDTSGYEKGLKDSESKMKKAGSAIGNGLKTAAKVGAAAIGVASTAIGALAKKSIDNYAEYEQLVGGVDTLFKKSSERVQKYAENAYKTAGMSANEYMQTAIQSSAAMINSLGGDTEKAAEMTNMAITDMSDNMNKMGTNMQSLQDAYRGFSRANFTMLDNLSLGYSGTKEGMQSLLDDAEKISGIKYDISSYSDIVQAIHVIQEEMDIAGTTAKEASTTIEGSVNSMKSAWQNLATGLASGDADVGKLTKELVDSAKTVFDNVMPVARQALVGISEFIGEIAPVIAEELPSLVTELLPMIVNSGKQVLDGLVRGIVDNYQKIAQTGIDIISNLINGISQNLPQLAVSAVQIISDLALFLIKQVPTLVNVALNLIKGLANGLIKALPELIRQLPTIIDSIVTVLLDAIPLIVETGVELLSALVDNLPQIIDLIVEVLPEIVTKTIDALLKNLPKLAEAGVKLFTALITKMPQIAITIARSVPKIVTGIINALAQSAPRIVQSGFELFVSLVKKIPQVISSVKESVGNITSAIWNAFTDFSLYEAGVNLIKGLWEGISSVKDWIFDKVGGFGKGLVDKVKGVFKIKSPSRVFAEIGKFLALGLGEGWEDAFPDVQSEIEDDLAFDVGQAVSDIEASVRTTGADGELYTLSDIYSMMIRILESIETSGMNTVSAIENTDTSIILNDREFGRAVRKAYA